LAGVTLRQQQIWQTESGKPPRRLSVGEAAAFARVFGIPLAELMTPPPEEGRDLSGLIEVARRFHEWRREAGILAAQFQDIAKRISELGPEDIYDTDTAEKFAPGVAGISDQVIRDLEGLSDDYRAIAESVKKHGSVWSVIASLRDQITDDAAGPEPGESDGSR